MAASAGNGAWFSFLIGTVIVLVIAFSILAFARRRAGVGSLYSLVRPALGPTGSFITGWALLIGVIAIAAGSICGAGFFLSTFLGHFGLTAFSSILGQIVLDLLLLAGAIFLTITSVRVSARVSATLEVVSIIVIVATLVIIFFKSGNLFNASQFALTGSSFGGIVFAVVIAILGFVGFESAASLGAESKDPFRAIPRAVIGSAILAGFLYNFATYSQVAQFRGGAAALAKSASPMDDLTNQWGLSFLQPVLDFGFSASFFAVVVACITVEGDLAGRASRRDPCGGGLVDRSRVALGDDLHRHGRRLRIHGQLCRGLHRGPVFRQEEGTAEGCPLCRAGVARSRLPCLRILCQRLSRARLSVQHPALLLPRCNAGGNRRVCRVARASAGGSGARRYICRRVELGADSIPWGVYSSQRQMSRGETDV